MFHDDLFNQLPLPKLSIPPVTTDLYFDQNVLPCDWGDVPNFLIRPSADEIKAGKPVAVRGPANDSVISTYGWAFDSVDQQPISQVLVVSGNRVVRSITVNQSRPDVVASLNGHRGEQRVYRAVCDTRRRHLSDLCRQCRRQRLAAPVDRRRRPGSLAESCDDHDSRRRHPPREPDEIGGTRRWSLGETEQGLHAVDPAGHEPLFVRVDGGENSLGSRQLPDHGHRFDLVWAIPCHRLEYTEQLRLDDLHPGRQLPPVARIRVIHLEDDRERVPECGLGASPQMTQPGELRLVD